MLAASRSALTMPLPSPPACLSLHSSTTEFESRRVKPAPAAAATAAIGLVHDEQSLLNRRNGVCTNAAKLSLLPHCTTHTLSFQASIANETTPAGHTITPCSARCNIPLHDSGAAHSYDALLNTEAPRAGTAAVPSCELPASDAAQSAVDA